MKGFQVTLPGHTNQFWLCVLATVTVDAMILSIHQIQVQTCQTILPILMCVCGYACVDMFVDLLIPSLLSPGAFCTRRTQVASGSEA